MMHVIFGDNVPNSVARGLRSASSHLPQCPQFPEALIPLVDLPTASELDASSVFSESQAAVHKVPTFDRNGRAF